MLHRLHHELYVSLYLINSISGLNLSIFSCRKNLIILIVIISELGLTISRIETGTDGAVEVVVGHRRRHVLGIDDDRVVVDHVIEPSKGSLYLHSVSVWLLAPLKGLKQLLFFLLHGLDFRQILLHNIQQFLSLLFVLRWPLPADLLFSVVCLDEQIDLLLHHVIKFVADAVNGHLYSFRKFIVVLAGGLHADLYHTIIKLSLLRLDKIGLRTVVDWEWATVLPLPIIPRVIPTIHLAIYGLLLLLAQE